MKTEKEMKALKSEVEALNKKLAELSEEELKQVVGGNSLGTNKDGVALDECESKVEIIVPKSQTLDVQGGEGSGTTGGGAGILVPKTPTLIVVGDGKLQC